MNKDSKNYEDWFLKADHDLKAAEAILDYYEQPPTDTICYHCHQTAEKSLKGFLVYKEATLPKIHDLIALLSLCLPKDKTLEILRNEVRALNKYFIETKYPTDMPIDYPKEEAKDAISKAKFVMEVIKEKIGLK
ncbi:MAG: HEPN domain-containing protein [Elusimicrobiota bacterium]